MNKQALGLSALGFLLLTAPAFAQQTKTESKTEKSTQSDDMSKSTTDEEKGTKKSAKGATDTEVTPTSKEPAATGKDAKTHKTGEKSQSDTSGKDEKKD